MHSTISCFVDPFTKTPLCEDDEGNLVRRNDEQCAVYRHCNGVFDFTRPNKDQEFYDQRWNSSDHRAEAEDLENWWDEYLYPGRALLLKSMGDLRGKKILLLGNGCVAAEFHFLTLGARVVYTDLSMQACLVMREKLEQSTLAAMRESIEFHAVDAVHLPFADGEFDIIYGHAFAHHLGDLVPFMREVHRCLGSSGICRFLDSNYSPIWQLAKKTMLRPLQFYTHKRWGFSPEDGRATKRGGYRREELLELMRTTEFGRLYFEPFALFHFIFRRGFGKVFNYGMYRNHPRFMKSLTKVDRFLSRRSRMIAANNFELVWGFDKV